MAEERLIDDDKDRKYKIRKNADGEDELYIDDSSEDENEEQSSIPLFEVPYGDDDDDDAEALTPEQFAERERLKREEQLAREKQAASLLSEADKKLGSGNFEGARFAAAQAAEINPKSGGAYCTQLKALSRNFTDFTSLEDCLEAADGVKQYADKEQKSVGVYDGNVDFEVGNADVASAIVAVSGKLFRNKFTYTLFIDYNFVASDGNVRPALFRKFEEGFKPRNPARGRARHIYHRVPH